MSNLSSTISVVIPTLDRRHTLSRAINSVLKQTIPVNEIIIIDNGSIDGTLDMLQLEFPMVRCVSQPKLGVSAARNMGISLANSKWVALLDSDDAWTPTKLEKQIKKSNKNSNSRLIHTDEIWYRRGRRVNQMKKHKKRGGNIFEHCLPLCCISPSSVLMRKDLFEDIGLFDEELPVCEDYDMWLRISSREPISYVDEPLTIKYGGHEDQLSSKLWGMDRFRVQSLEKLLNKKYLNFKQENAVYEIMIKKINILIQGGTKRGNTDIVDIYSEKLDFWEQKKTSGTSNKTQVPT